MHDLALAPGEEITLEVHKKKNVLGELFGAIPLKRPTSELLKQVREELEGDLV